MPKTTAELLRLENVRFAYGESAAKPVPKAVIDGISVAINAGEFVAVCGANGAGKSTLLKLMSGFLTPNQGTVSLMEKPLAAYTGFERAQRLAAVVQPPAVEMPFSVGQMVAMGRYPQLGHFQPLRAQDREAVVTALRLTNMLALEHRIFDTLSAGERQLTLLARGIAQQTPLLLLDEPTAHLDPQHTLQIVQTIRQLRQSPTPCALVVVSHDLNLMARLADRILLISKGKIAISGTPSEVLTDASLRAVFACDLRVHRGAHGAPQVELPL